MTREPARRCADDDEFGGETLERFLETQETLRCLFYPCLELGLHANTARMVKRLATELGYRGTIEIYYYDDELHPYSPRERDKLRTVFGEVFVTDSGLNPARETVRTLGDATLIFRAFSSWQLLNGTRVELGFSGGVDFCDYGSWRENFAKYVLNVNYFLVIQPYRWPAHEPSCIQTNLENALTPERPTNLDEVLPGFRERAVFVPEPVFGPSEERAFRSTPEFRAKLTAYQAVTQRDDLHLMPVYGLSHFDAEKRRRNGVAGTTVSAEMILFNLLAAILRSSPTKKVVVVVLSELPACLARLQKILRPGSRHPLAGYVEAERLGERITIESDGRAVNDEYVDSFSNDSKQQILVVALGRIPSYAFDYLFSISDFPAVFEGQGTANTMVSFRKPFIQLNSPLHEHRDGDEDRGWYPNLPSGSDGLATIAAELERVVVREVSADEHCWTSSLASGTPTPADTIASLLTAMLRAESDIRRYFDALGHAIDEMDEDKFLAGARYCLKLRRSRALGGNGMAVDQYTIARARS